MIGFQPFIPQGGYAGWSFLERTEESQRSAFEKSPEIERDMEYFKENIAAATTPEDIVGDRRLLKIALGAFGLDDDLNKQAYILKVLSEGSESDTAFSNRLVDKRYKALAETFGFGNVSGTRVSQSDFAEKILSDYKTRQFEIAVGDSDESMRLALSFRREISNFSDSTNSENAMWYKIMGNPPMKSVLKTAFGLPSEFDGIDIDTQRQFFQEKSRELLGSSAASVFQDDNNINKLIQTFFVRKQIADNPVSNVRGTVALSLLRNTSAAMSSFFQSRL